MNTYNTNQRRNINPPGPPTTSIRGQAPPNIVNHPPPSHVPEMLDQVKMEFEAMYNQLSMQKTDKNEFERQIQAQIQEMEQMQVVYTSLESSHRRIRQQYEEDVMRLRRQLRDDSNGSQKTNKRGRPLIDDHIDNQRIPPVTQARAPPTSTPVPSHSRQPRQPIHSQHHGLSQQHQSNENTIHSLSRNQSVPVSQHMETGMSRTNHRVGAPQSQVLHEKIQKHHSNPPPSSHTINAIKTEGIQQTITSVPSATPSNTSENAVSMQDNNVATKSTNSLTASSVSEGQTEDISTSTATADTSNKNNRSKVKWTITYTKKSPEFQEYDRPDVEMLHTLDHHSVVCCVRFSADGSMMASGCHKTAQIFDVESSKEIFSVTRPELPSNSDGEDAYVRAVCFSPNGKKLVAGMPQNIIRTWDIESKEEGFQLKGHESEIYSLDYVNNLIASGSGDRKVRLWDAKNGSCHAVFGSEQNGPSDGVTSVAISPDGGLVAAASLDKIVRVWDTTTTKLMDQFEGHSDSVYSIAFSPDGKNIISGSLDRTLMLWDVSRSSHPTNRPKLLFQGHKDFVLSVAYSPDGRWLMSGSKDRSVVFWDPRSTRSMLTLSGYRNSVISVSSSPSSSHFATGSGDCFACIWKYQRQTI